MPPCSDPTIDPPGDEDPCPPMATIVVATEIDRSIQNRRDAVATTVAATWRARMKQLKTSSFSLRMAGLNFARSVSIPRTPSEPCDDTGNEIGQ